MQPIIDSQATQVLELSTSGAEQEVQVEADEQEAQEESQDQQESEAVLKNQLSSQRVETQRPFKRVKPRVESHSVQLEELEQSRQPEEQGVQLVESK